MAARTRLGEVLIDRGLLAPRQLDRALAEQSVSREPLGQILVRCGILDRTELAAALNEQMGRWLAIGLAAGFLAAHPALALARMTTAPLTVSVEVPGRATVAAGPAAAGDALTLSCGSADTMRVTYLSAGIEPLPPYKLSLQPLATTTVQCGKSGDAVGVALPQEAPRAAILGVEVAY